MNLPAIADQAGIIGASGSAYPLGARLRARADVVIANGAECEPLLASDRSLMALAPELILEGLSLAMEATGALRGVVAVRASEERALARLSGAAKGLGHIEVHPLPDVYPVGDAHVLVPMVTGRAVPEGGRPEGAGVVVANVHTLWHLARAVEPGCPVTWRYVTVGGAVAQPQVLRVPQGMVIADLLALCGGVTAASPIYILGGPMQGRLVEDAQSPLGKAHGGLFVFDRGHGVIRGREMPVQSRVKQAASACAGCRRCTEYCPRGQLGHHLRPHTVIRALAEGVEAPEAFTGAPLCSGCGLCEVVCPAGLSPRSLYQAVQGALQAQGWQNIHRDPAPQAREGHDGRRVPRSEVVKRLGLTAWMAPPRVEDVDLAPQRVRLPIGEGDQLLVEVGDRLHWAQPVSRPAAGSSGPWTHAPMPGRVMAVGGGVVEIHA